MIQCVILEHLFTIRKTTSQVKHLLLYGNQNQEFRTTERLHFYCFAQFFLFFSFTAEANQNATKMVIDAVVADHGGNENCPWSVAEL